MRTFILLLFVFCVSKTSICQNKLGVDVGYATARAAVFGVKFFNNQNVYGIGFATESRLDVGRKVKSAPSNYTFTYDDPDGHFRVFDFTYGRMLSGTFFLSGDLTLGVRNFYRAYSDQPSEERVYIIERRKVIAGIGVAGTYYFIPALGAYFSANTIKEFGIGISVRFSNL